MMASQMIPLCAQSQDMAFLIGKLPHFNPVMATCYLHARPAMTMSLPELEQRS
jgi:hypothetical protein